MRGIKGLVKLSCFFVCGHLPTATAEFVECKLFGRIDLVSVGDVVLTFTHGADEGYDDALFLFCHIKGIIPYSPRTRQEGAQFSVNIRHDQ